MKKILVILLAVSLAGIITSCSFGRKHTTIVESDNNHYTKIEYSGDIHFKNDGTGIASISRGGYIKYQHNDLKLEAENNGAGGVKYALYDGSNEINANDGKALIAEAVMDMIKKAGQNPRWR